MFTFLTLVVIPIRRGTGFLSCIDVPSFYTIFAAASDCAGHECITVSALYRIYVFNSNIPSQREVNMKLPVLSFDTAYASLAEGYLSGLSNSMIQC
jgi:hypothetical protein